MTQESYEVLSSLCTPVIVCKLLHFNLLIWNHYASWNKLCRNVHWVVLYVFYSEIHHRNKRTTCFCMWNIYFYADFDDFYSVFLTTFSLCWMPTDFVLLLLISRNKGITIGAKTQYFQFFSLFFLDSLGSKCTNAQHF